MSELFNLNSFLHDILRRFRLLFNSQFWKISKKIFISLKNFKENFHTCENEM